MGVFKQIKSIVKQIPKGKVTTYGAIAKALEIKDARVIGWAIYGNTDPSIPCHRVVFKNGLLAKKYSLGGWQEQKKRLLKEGIRFTEKFQVDLKKHLWKPRT